MGGWIFHIKKVSFYLWHKHKFIQLYYSDNIKKPLYITPFCIELGENVNIWYNARIEGVRKYNNTLFTPRIIIRESVSIQQNIHLTCANRVEIGANTAIAANVTITDIHHPYIDVNVPIERQDLEVGFVEIGDECKIYNNSVVLPNTKIGKHVTVGANSVVQGNIPDYSVVVGAPARIVKRYDFEQKRWRNTDSFGKFEK